METKYCGACRGERGCSNCKSAVKSAVYTGLTEFFAEGVFCEDAVSGGSGSVGTMISGQTELLLAADLGTTTLGFVCADANGTVLASYGVENPQRSTAADVIGRMDAAVHGTGERLKNEIREALAKGFLFVLEKAASELENQRIFLGSLLRVRIAVAGNTIMQHLLLGYPVDGMAKAPFVPYVTEKVKVSFADLFSETACFEAFAEAVKYAEVTVFPCFSAFVGGDVAAGAYALFPEWRQRTGQEVCTAQREGKPDVCLLLDLGTNGELLLLTHGKLYGTAAAMGSAFEGGRFAYATDLFRLIGKALRQKVLDETGLLSEPYFTNGFCGLMQEDVRSFQLAKGALRAGIELLCAYASVDLREVETVFLAGSAGRYCRKEDLFTTGLLPEEFCGKVNVVGNSCIGGLLCYLKNRETMIHCKGEILNLAEVPEFEEAYYRSMNFTLRE